MLYLPHSSTNFNNFWQKIAVVFELSSAYLIYYVRLLLHILLAAKLHMQK